MKSEKAKQREDAKQEACITPREMADELVPILKEYFIAKIKGYDNYITMRFPNGEQLLITVS